MTVRTDANLNYPFVLSRGAVVLGHVQVAKWPEESQGKVVLTGHDSDHKAESMPDGIEDYTPLVCTLVPIAASIHAIRADYKNGTVTAWSIADDVDTCTFNGWVMSIKKNDADGAKPDAIKFDVTIQPTGGLAWTPS